jgi:hypothetical protein
VAPAAAQFHQVRIFLANGRGELIPATRVWAQPSTSSARRTPEPPTATKIWSAFTELEQGDWDFFYESEGFYPYEIRASITAATDVVVYKIPRQNGVTAFLPMYRTGSTPGNLALPSLIAQEVTMTVRLPTDASFPVPQYELDSSEDGVVTRAYIQQQWNDLANPNSVRMGRYLITMSPPALGTHMILVSMRSGAAGDLSTIVRPTVQTFISGNYGTQAQGNIATSSYNPTNAAGKRAFHAINLSFAAAAANCVKLNYAGQGTLYNDLASIPDSTSTHLDYDVSMCYSPPSDCGAHPYLGRTTSQCGVFGDPHVLQFNGSVGTCGTSTVTDSPSFPTHITIIDNNYVTITAQTQKVYSTTFPGATKVVGFDLVYKSPCNPIRLHWDATATLSLSGVNSPKAVAHEIRIVGSDVYIDALHLRFRVVNTEGRLQFGLSLDSGLAAASTGTCRDSCTEYQQREVPSTPVSAGHADCGLITNPGIRAACSFDTSIDVNWLGEAQTIGTTLSEVAQAWTPLTPPPPATPEAAPADIIPTAPPSDPPSNPSPSTAPSDHAPSDPAPSNPSPSGPSPSGPSPTAQTPPSEPEPPAGNTSSLNLSVPICLIIILAFLGLF